MKYLSSVVLGCLLVFAFAGPASAKDRIYWSTITTNSISAANADGSGDGVSTSGGAIDAPTGMAIDPVNGRIYWGDLIGNEIFVADLDDLASAQVLYSSGVGTPWGLQFDQLTQTLYWTDYVGDRILSAPADGSGSPTVLFSGGALNTPLGLAIDHASDKIYWTNSANNTAAVGPLGGGAASVLASGFSSPVSMAVAPEVDSMWVTNNGNGTISRGTASGTNFISIPSIPFQPGGISVDSAMNRMFWGNGTGAPISVAGLDGGGQGDLNTTPVSSAFPVSTALLLEPRNVVAPVVGGDAVVGSQLSCSSGSWAPNQPGAQMYQAPKTTPVQWQLGGADIAGATSSTFTPSTAGSYRCVVTATNYAGSTSVNSQAVTVSAPPAPTPPTPVAAPGLSKLVVSPRRPRKVTKKVTVSFNLSQDAKVTLLVQRKFGRMQVKACQRTSGANRLKKRCPIYRNVTTSSTSFAAGTREFTVNGEQLAPGAYRATLTATNGGGDAAPLRAIFYQPWW